jgi:hypothetical protein
MEYGGSKMRFDLSIGEDWLSVLVAAAIVLLTLAGIFGPGVLNLAW